MPVAAAALSRVVLDAVEREWEISLPPDIFRAEAGEETGGAVRLQGGEESAAYRCGELVVRIGPRWRSTEEAEWCHEVALRAAAGGVKEVVRPLSTRQDRTVVRVRDHPVSVWRYVVGDWLDRDDPAQRAQAARLLGRLHRALLTCASSMPARPVPSGMETGLHGEAWNGPPNLVDTGLDRWLAGFHRLHPLAHPLHGDYYRANLLVRDDRLVAVLDWDEALVGPPALEVATAAREFSDPWSTDLGPAQEFITEYAAEGGTAFRPDEEALAQLIRHRLRCEATAFETQAARGEVHTQEDIDYHQRRLALFSGLRP